MSGVDGALAIGFGEIVSLPVGSEKHYSSINIAAGGLLQITGTCGIVVMTCSGNCVIDGQINGSLCTGEGGSFSKLAEDTGRLLAYTPARGAGADSGGYLHYGGFGAGSGGNATATQGGVGANGTDPAMGGAGGTEAEPGDGAQLGKDGDAAPDLNPDPSDGAGGGGGGPGRNGAYLFLKVQGDLSGSGTLIFGGSYGGSGGNGAAGANGGMDGVGGGGGGGGAAGIVDLWVHGTDTSSLNIQDGQGFPQALNALSSGTLVGGSGGAGGSGGTAGSDGSSATFLPIRTF